MWAQLHKLSSTDTSSSKSVFISWYGSLLSLNPLVSFNAAWFSLYTGIKATQNINTVSLVILLDLQARLFDRERNQCEIFFTREMTRLCQPVLFSCLSFPYHCSSSGDNPPRCLRPCNVI